MTSSSDPLELKPVGSGTASFSDPRKSLRRREWMQWFNLQWAHRVGSVALIVLVAAIAAAIKNEGPFGLYFAAAAIIADIGVIGAILAWWTTRRLGQRSWEPIGAIVFNLIVFILATGIYAAGKLGYLDPSIQWALSFFPTPS